MNAWVPPFFSNIAIFWTVPNAENTLNKIIELELEHQMMIS